MSVPGIKFINCDNLRALRNLHENKIALFKGEEVVSRKTRSSKQ